MEPLPQGGDLELRLIEDPYFKLLGLPNIEYWEGGMVSFRGWGFLGLVYGFIGLTGIQLLARTVTGDPAYFQKHLTGLGLVACLIAGLLCYVTGIWLNKNERKQWKQDSRPGKFLLGQSTGKYKTLIPMNGRHQLMSYNLEHWFVIYIFIWALGVIAGFFF
ncbi:hypothetical protein HSX37_14900|uniref:hypothetical protein n=1 Tax=Dendrosporobacter quercicolus TaxID=146817 RepID=UPI00157128C1|nr:hypothetical protein [Dendrosporobacter quercicolus]NSL49322.1 hypothetical protein [Dendrosporobacter quercicolus DSM 1736]